MIVAVGIVDLAGLGAVDLGGDCHQVARRVASGGHLSGAAGCGGGSGVAVAGRRRRVPRPAFSAFAIPCKA